MRLTCPNCGAEYEVPDEVIPTDGRDVQCSNCGDTWFQTHADQSQPAEIPQPAQTPDPTDSEMRAALHGRTTSEPEPDDPAEDDQFPQKPDHPVAQEQLDPSFKEILREEAAHEAELRAAETHHNIESQPDLGLDDISDEPTRRAREARDQMARIRGNTPKAETTPEADPVSDLVSRRGLLPDIEEINSTLRAGSNKSVAPTAIAPVLTKNPRNKRGFTRGFAVAVLIAAAVTMVYVNAAQISQSFPQLDPVLNAYVIGIDQARIWLDAQIGNLIPKN